MVINRYSRPEMAAIWSDENKYKAWLEVEILADEAWAELGEIPAEDVKKGEIFLSLFYYDSWISARAFLNWKKNRIEVKVTARISAIGSAV